MNRDMRETELGKLTKNLPKIALMQAAFMKHEKSRALLGRGSKFSVRRKA